MKKYKLIKEYPGSLKLGTEVNYSETHLIYNYNGGDFYTELPKHQVENLPEFWEEVKEIPKYLRCILPCETYMVVGRVYEFSRKSGEHYRLECNLDCDIYPAGSGLYVYPYNLAPATKEEYDAQVKPILFVTEDGKGIREGDTYWFINSIFDKLTLTADKTCGKNSKYYKYFSTEQAAQEYIDMNKPIYSKRQAIDMIKQFDKELTECGDYEDDIYTPFLL